MKIRAGVSEPGAPVFRQFVVGYDADPLPDRATR